MNCPTAAAACPAHALNLPFHDAAFNQSHVACVLRSNPYLTGPHLLLRLSCKHRGVFWDRKTRRWRCQLGYQSKKIFLGYFDDAGEAARAYDQKLVELRGAGGAHKHPQLQPQHFAAMSSTTAVVK